MKLLIVEATKKHLERIEQLYRRFAQDEYAQMVKPNERLRPVEERTQIVLKVLDQFGHLKRTWMVALLEEQVVGTVLLTLRPHPFLCGEVGRIDLVTVDRNYRRHGVGRALVESACRLAAQQGCAWVSLEVLEGNRPAIDLYESAGFLPLTREMVRSLG